MKMSSFLQMVSDQASADSKFPLHTALEEGRTNAKPPCPTRHSGIRGHARTYERASAPGHETRQALGRCRSGSSSAPSEPTPIWHPTPAHTHRSPCRLWQDDPPLYLA